MSGVAQDRSELRTKHLIEIKAHGDYAASRAVNSV
jgi:hypothetical protein